MRDATGSSTAYCVLSARATRSASTTITTIEILHTLKPLGVAMAGRDTFDAYKD